MDMSWIKQTFDFRLLDPENTKGFIAHQYKIRLRLVLVIDIVETQVDFRKRFWRLKLG